MPFWGIFLLEYFWIIPANVTEYAPINLFAYIFASSGGVTLMYRGTWSNVCAKKTIGSFQGVSVHKGRAKAITV